MSRYTLELENDKLLNIIPLIAFLKSNEGTDIELAVNQESHCLQFCQVYKLLDIFDFNSVTIYTDNIIENSKNSKYNIVTNRWHHWLYKGGTQFNRQFESSWNGKKIFGCFYGRPSAPRLGFASYLHKNYYDKSVLCVKFTDVTEDDRKLFDLERIFSWQPDILDLLASLIKDKVNIQYNFLAYNYSSGEYDFNHPLNNLYNDIFVDIIVEAHNLGNSFYPTEKLARAVLCKKPFIVMASKNYLQYLKQIGFRTFEKYWDEKYDFYDGKVRYFAILNLIDNLAMQSTNELDQIYKDMQEVLDHNYNLLIDSGYNKIVSKIDV